jgi:hypothetical protein
MWQHHYLMQTLRLEELRAEAERERRWRRQDEANGRPAPARAPGRPRAFAARAVASVSRSAARLACRLDGRVTVDLGRERVLRDA